MVTIKPLCEKCALPVVIELSAENLEVIEKVEKGLKVRCSVCNGGKLWLWLPNLEPHQSVLKPSGQPGQ
jgi:hypothetical protein